jgi:hypothetical protein
MPADGREHEFGDGNQDATYALVAYAEDLLTVGHDDVVNIIRIDAFGKACIHFINLMDVEENPLWAAKDVRIILDSLAFRGCVDYAEDL